MGWCEEDSRYMNRDDKKKSDLICMHKDSKDSDIKNSY